MNGTLGTIEAVKAQRMIVRLDAGDNKDINNDRRVIVDLNAYHYLDHGYAATIHKAQGKSFDKVYIDLATGAFAHGQLYVALSRCRTLEGLTLKRAITQSDIILDKRIVEFLNIKFPLRCTMLDFVLRQLQSLLRKPLGRRNNFSMLS